MKKMLAGEDLKGGDLVYFKRGKAFKVKPPSLLRRIWRRILKWFRKRKTKKFLEEWIKQYQPQPPQLSLGDQLRLKHLRGDKMCETILLHYELTIPKHNKTAKELWDATYHQEFWHLYSYYVFVKEWIKNRKKWYAYTESGYWFQRMDKLVSDDMKEDEYQCTVCHEVFKKELTDEEAKEQLKDEFPGIEPEECDLVCDDCYKKMFGDDEE